MNEYGVTPSKKGQGGGSGGSRGGNGGKRSLDVSSMSDFAVKAVLGVGAFGKVFLGARRGLGPLRSLFPLSAPFSLPADAFLIFRPSLPSRPVPRSHARGRGVRD